MLKRIPKSVAVRSSSALIGVLTTLALVACSDLASSPSIPEGTQSPSTYYTRQGALDLTRLATNLFKDVSVTAALKSGTLADELYGYEFGAQGWDARNLPESTSLFDADPLYANLHKLRGQARLARGVLSGYAPDLSPAIQGQLYAYEAYADVFLAELYCSGVPLSVIDFDGDFSYQGPSTTQEVYEQAVALFDSALAIASDSASVQTLATVGKGRALLGLGRWADAATAVAGVNDTARYAIPVSFVYAPPTINNRFWDLSVSDREGGNGLPFRSSGDPRTAASAVEIRNQSNTLIVWFPNKYLPIDNTSFTVASGIEARLIEAEADLKASSPGSWLETLNRLRTTGSYSRIDTASSGQVDTVWDAGAGGVPGLGVLQDPGTATGRVRLLFDERAAWLFVSGQRQGDLRRLVRQYGVAPNTIYPTGAYTNGANGTSPTGKYYGDYIDVPVPGVERRNPLFRGCLNRD